MAQATSTTSVTPTTPVTPVTQATRDAATNVDALALNSLTLLGTYENPQNTKALIRKASGRIVTVTLGDKIGRHTVIAIATGSLTMVRNNHERQITLPASKAP